MTGPDPAVAAVRLAVRRCLGEVSAEASRQELSAEASGQEAPAEASGQEAPGAVRPVVLVACSGGADSLALAAAVARGAPALRLRAGAVVVDHGLQPGSGEVAARAATQCGDLGLDPVLVQRVRVELGPDGPEASARRARYAALEQVAGERGAAAVLLGHTRDDQAEQVLLGLARGSGARSLSGMPRRRGLLHRPLLGVERDMTERACEAEGLQPWHDPQNQDRTYRRVRARRLLALLEQELGPGVKASLARSADLLRQDSDALEAMAHDALLRLAGSSPAAGLPVAPLLALPVAPLLALPVAPLLDLPIAPLLELPDAVRTRVWRAAAIAAGSPAGSVSAAHVQAVDALVRDWHGQGPVALPGGVRARRCGDRVLFEPAGPVE